MSRPSKDIKAEYITITELSKLVSKSPQSIYKKMKQKPSFNQYIRVFDGKKFVHKSAVWEEFGVAIDGCEPDESKGLENPQPDSPLVSVLTDQVQAQKQQIENMQRTIDSLTEALKAEQILRANADQRIAALLEDMQNRERDTGTFDQMQNREQSAGNDTGTGQEQTTEAPAGETKRGQATGTPDGQEQTISPEHGQTREPERTDSDQGRQQGSDSAPLDRDQKQQPGSEPLDGDQEPERQKPLTFLDRIMKALGFR